jgi:serine/threonine-protein kinase RsbW
VTAERRVFPARAAALAEVSDFVERACAGLAAGGEATLRALLVAEELFINSVIHGYGGDSPGSVRLALRDRGRDLELTVEDDAPEFDPFANLAPLLAGSDPAHRAVGGLGRILVAELTSTREYARRGGTNRVTVGILKGRDAPRAKKA